MLALHFSLQPDLCLSSGMFFSRSICQSLPLTIARRPRAPRGTRRSPTPGSAPSYTRQGTLSQPPSAALGKDDGKPLYLCSPFVNSALVKGNFKTIVVLPKYVDIMEWVAVNSEHSLIWHAQHFSHRRVSAFSFWFLHQPERVLWSLGGVLYADDVSDDVCRTQVCLVVYRLRVGLTNACI